MNLFSKKQILVFSVLLILGVVFIWFFYPRPDSDIRKNSLTGVRTIYNSAFKFGEPFGIAERNGEIFVSDGEQGKIWRTANRHDFAVVSDKFDTPSAIAFDSSGDLIIADSGSSTVKKLNISTGETEIIAGIENKFGFADGDAKNALFNAPIGVAIGLDGRIFVSDTYNDRIRVIDNGVVSTVAGGEQGFADGAGAAAKFDTPCGIAVLEGAGLIVADSKNRRLRIIESGGTVSTLAGNGEPDSRDGSLLNSGFVEPTAVTINSTGVIFVADGNSVRVLNRRFFPFVETISGTKRGFADGNPKQSRFNRPSGLVADAAGNLYVADSENQSIRIFTAENVGTLITEDEKKALRLSPEEFRNAAAPRWTFDPPEHVRDIAGTIGEIRGEVSAAKQAWFHNGFDIAGAYGETARFVRGEKVLRPTAIENFSTLRELIRMPTLGYIHIRLGRDSSNNLFEDKRFQFSFDSSKKPKGVRVRRGAQFKAGEAIGTLNRFNHVHLIAGRSGAEMNALDALTFPNISDTIAPTIEKVSLFDENWNEIETESKNGRIKLTGKIRIVARAFDRMNGNGQNRKLGVYRLGYQILRADKTPSTELNWTISFDRPPDEDLVKLVYAPGSQSGYAPQTIFNYIITNRVSGEQSREDFFDAAGLENGNYILRIFAADFFGNNTFNEINFEISK